MKPWIGAAVALMLMSSAAQADELVVYGAGSLREAIGQIASQFGQAHGLTITTEFGPSGRMRERIEKGDHVDLFTSADVGHPRKLMAGGRADVMAMFARNTVCLLSPARFGATTDTVLGKLLAPGVRVGMSPPKVDPLGEYTERLFELMDKVRPGAAAAMQARGVVLDTPPGAPVSKLGDTDADASWMAGSMPASFIVPDAIATLGCYRTPRLCSFRLSCRSDPSTRWRC